jgi:hypothetical protein
MKFADADFIKGIESWTFLRSDDKKTGRQGSERMSKPSLKGGGHEQLGNPESS